MLRHRVEQAAFVAEETIDRGSLYARRRRDRPRRQGVPTLFREEAARRGDNAPARPLARPTLFGSHVGGESFHLPMIALLETIRRDFPVRSITTIT